MTEEGQLAIQVSDKGIGIPPEDQELVFSPFMRAASALSRSHEGTGLGLSLVKVFVEMHGGYIDLQSKVDEGTAFTIYLPKDRVLPSEQAAQ